MNKLCLTKGEKRQDACKEETSGPPSLQLLSFAAAPQPAPRFWASAAPQPPVNSPVPAPRGHTALLAKAALCGAPSPAAETGSQVRPVNSNSDGAPHLSPFAPGVKLAELASRNRLSVYFNFPGLQWSEVLPA